MISAIIITKNEEKNLTRCLESIRWCDEIIVIDDGSTDRTVEIAKKYKSIIYSRSLNCDFSAQRNFGISKTRGEWILFVDADELISDALTYEIQNAIGLRDQNLRNYNGFYLKRSDFMWGKQLRYGEANISLLRLGRKGTGVWKGMTHEKWSISGPTGKLINPILHFPHKTLEEFLKEINHYTDIRAKELNRKKVRVFFWSIILYPLGKFLLNYFVKKGFQDGIEGLIFALTMSFHSFLVRGKLWAMSSKDKPQLS
jgi:glycosyltransferase involved in cell wall biosynthesis